MTVDEQQETRGSEADKEKESDGDGGMRSQKEKNVVVFVCQS